MEQHKTPRIIRSTPGGARWRRLLIGLAVIGTAGGAWLAMQPTPPSTPAVETPAIAPTPPPVGVSAAAPSLQNSVAAAPAAASAVLAAASGPPLPPVESAAESLRKVQLALSGGSAQDDLVAAITLQSCAHADKMANDLVQGRDAMKWLPLEVRKIVDKFPRISDEQIDRAQREQRRCQVFDAATLASRGDLYRKAFDGRAEDAAGPYLQWLKTDGAQDKPDPVLIARVQAAVRADAQAADLGTLGSFAFGGRYTADQTGADPVQARAYAEAYFRIAEEGPPGQAASARDLASKIASLGPAEPALTQQQQQNAEALTQQIVKAWHRRLHP
jgi:hypothetical protein